MPSRSESILDNDVEPHAPRQPHARHSEVALRGGERDVEQLGSLGAPASEKRAQLHQFRLTGIEGRQFGKGLIQIEDVVVTGVDKLQVVAERYSHAPGAALVRRLGANVIDQNMTHCAGGEPKEGAAVREAGAFLPKHLQIQVVHEHRGLKGARAVAADEARGHGPKLGVHLGHEPVEGGGLPLTPAVQQLRQMTWYLGHGVAR